MKTHKETQVYIYIPVNTAIETLRDTDLQRPRYIGDIGEVIPGDTGKS